MALGRHLVAALPGSSTAAVFIPVTGAASAVVAEAPVTQPAGPAEPAYLIHEYRPVAPRQRKHRQGALHALTSHRFTRALRTRNVQGITYRDLIGRRGLEAMRGPAG